MLTKDQKRKIKDLWERGCKKQDRASILQAWELYKALSPSPDKSFEKELGEVRQKHVNKKVEAAIKQSQSLLQKWIIESCFNQFFLDANAEEFWYATSPYSLSKGEPPSKYTPLNAPKTFFDQAHSNDYSPAIKSAGLSDIKERLYKDFCFDSIPVLEGEDR